MDKEESEEDDQSDSLPDSSCEPVMAKLVRMA